MKITELTKRDIRSSFEWWRDHHSAEQADRWYRGVYQSIISLRQMPERCVHKTHLLALRASKFISAARLTHPTSSWHLECKVVRPNAGKILRSVNRLGAPQNPFQNLDAGQLAATIKTPPFHPCLIRVQSVFNPWLKSFQPTY